MPIDERETRAVREVVHEVVARHGLEVLFMTIGSARNLRIVLDHEQRPVNLDDCTHVNRGVRSEMEHEGLPMDDYSIEVESPGTDRQLITLRHYERFLGERVRVQFLEPHAGQAVFKGRLESVRDGEVRMLLGDDEELIFTPEEVRRANLIPGGTK